MMKVITVCLFLTFSIITGTHASIETDASEQNTEAELVANTLLEKKDCCIAKIKPEDKRVCDEIKFDLKGDNIKDYDKCIGRQQAYLDCFFGTECDYRKKLDR